MKQKILLAAIDCIEKYGMDKLTIRRIAKEANVNVAAINYYFSSKQKLLDELYRHTLYTGFDENIDDYLRQNTASPRKAMELFLLHMIEGGINYPNLTKMHLYEPFIKSNTKTISIKRMNAFLRQLETAIKTMFPGALGKNAKMTMIQLWSAILFPIIFPGILREYSAFDFKSEEKRKEYVNSLIERFLND